MATITLEIPDELISQIMQLGDRFPDNLLVDCLASDCYVSREVGEEIESTLLLPSG